MYEFKAILWSGLWHLGPMKNHILLSHIIPLYSFQTRQRHFCPNEDSQSHIETWRGCKISFQAWRGTHDSHSLECRTMCGVEYLTLPWNPLLQGGSTPLHRGFLLPPKRRSLNCHVLMNCPVGETWDLSSDILACKSSCTCMQARSLWTSFTAWFCFHFASWCSPHQGSFYMCP